MATASSPSTSYDATAYRLTRDAGDHGAIVRDADGDSAPLAAQPNPLQRLLYTHDPVGNIVEIEDLAQDKVFNEGVVEPRRLYQYDRALPPRRRRAAASMPSQTCGGARAPRARPRCPSRFPRADMQASAALYPALRLRPGRQHHADAPRRRRRRLDPRLLYDYQARSASCAPSRASPHPGNSNRLYSTQLRARSSPSSTSTTPPATSWRCQRSPRSIGTSDEPAGADADRHHRRRITATTAAASGCANSSTRATSRRSASISAATRTTAAGRGGVARPAPRQPARGGRPAPRAADRDREDCGRRGRGGQSPVLRYQLDDHLERVPGGGRGAGCRSPTRNSIPTGRRHCTGRTGAEPEALPLYGDGAGRGKRARLSFRTLLHPVARRDGPARTERA